MGIIPRIGNLLLRRTSDNDDNDNYSSLTFFSFLIVLQLNLSPLPTRTVLIIKEIKVFCEAKKLVIKNYINYFGSCIYLLWNKISKYKYSSISNTAFEGYLANKKQRISVLK